MSSLSLKIVYGNTNRKTAYEGIVLQHGFNEYLSKRVKKRFYDIDGTMLLIKEFENIASTGFEKSLLVNIFSISPPAEDWRIGEALAECYLEDFEGARFYYPPFRDARNPKANLQGADLVGFVDIDEENTIFLFGEVKTSEDKNSPPQVMYGRSGLIDQLRSIQGDPNLQKSLISWLGFKVQPLSEEDPFKKDYFKALKTYLKEEAEYKYFLFGVLIRDTEPKSTDLKSRYESLKNNLSKGARLKLIALYIPISIKNMKNYIVDEGG